jgi:hypothetical protein
VFSEVLRGSFEKLRRVMPCVTYAGTRRGISEARQQWEHLG